MTLVQSNSTSIYTNTVAVSAASVAGNVAVTVTATDANALTGSANVPLAIAASTEVWNGGGANQNWGTNPNWVSGFAPGYTGDALVFAGSLGLAPNMDANYGVTGLVFSNNASSFTLGTASGTLTLAGNLVNNSANAQTLNVPLALGAAVNINAAAGSLTLNSNITLGASALTLTGNNNLALNGNVTGTGALTKQGAGALTLGGASVSAGTVSFNNGATLISGVVSSAGGTTYIGYLTNNAAVTVAGGVLNAAGEVRVGGSDQNGSAIIGSGSLTLTGGAANVGSLRVARGNYLDNSESGTVTVNAGSTLVSTNDVVIQFAGAGHGTVAVNGGTFIIGPGAAKWFMIGYYDTGSAELDVSSGSLLLENGTSIKLCRSGNTGGNVVNQTGGNVTFYSDAGTTVGGGGALDLNYAGGAACSNVYNLNGGTLTVPQIISSQSAATRLFNFNGGTLKPAAASATFFNSGAAGAANVRNGGAIIDDGGFAVTIGQALVHSSIAGDAAKDGGLTKLGSGTLTLNGANTYTGNTTVKAGTLAIAQAVLATNSTVTISNGAVLALGFATTNRVGGLVLDGVAQSPGVYNSTTTPAYLSGAGSLLVASAIASNPTNITATVSSGVMTLSWPDDHLGWILQQQTNSLSAGLGTNWVDVAGSGAITSTNIAINPAAPTVFYRLRYPQ